MNYNIYIVNRETKKAVAVKWIDVSERKLQDRCLFAMRNLDTQNYFVDDVEVGSPEDVVYTANLLSIK